jgi:hypothetical protein
MLIASHILGQLAGMEEIIEGTGDARSLVAGQRKVLVMEDDCVDQVPDPLLQLPVRRDVTEA